MAFTIEKHRVVAKCEPGWTFQLTRQTAREFFAERAEDDEVYLSSTMSFPAEETDDADTQQLANDIVAGVL